LALLDSLLNLLVTTAIADQAGRFIYQLARQGIQLTLPDALIAVTGLQYDLILATTNAKYFQIPGLGLYTL
jgi:predicted nucleic acid-binding protein